MTLKAAGKMQRVADRLQTTSSHLTGFISFGRRWLDLALQECSKALAIFRLLRGAPCRAWWTCAHRGGPTTSCGASCCSALRRCPSMQGSRTRSWQRARCLCCVRQPNCAWQGCRFLWQQPWPIYAAVPGSSVRFSAPRSAWPRWNL